MSEFVGTLDGLLLFVQVCIEAAEGHIVALELVQVCKVRHVAHVDLGEKKCVRL